jgi:uncharacterized protein (DUF1015 family)
VPEIQPFRGIRYRVPDERLPRVLAPPYDVITPALQAELHARDPRNIVRVVLSREPGEAAYATAGAAYRGWQAEGTLRADEAPALYLVEQDFTLEGRGFRRAGLLARFRAEDAETGRILPHEHTRKGPREDRYRLLRATRANFSPIFLMFHDTAGRFTALARAGAGGPPIAAFRDDGGVEHRLFRVTDEALLAGFAQALGAERAYIADGHHRYATALRYRDETGPDGAWSFGYFTPMDGDGLRVLPYHRVLSAGPDRDAARVALTGRFRLTPAQGVAAAARSVAGSAAAHAFALAWPGGEALVAEALPGTDELLPSEAPPSLRALDTYFFHEAVLSRLLSVPGEAVSYVHSLAEAEAAAAGEECALVALMRPTPVRQIVDVAEARESMPAKSTFFHPKLPSGLVIHPLVA